jgi:hypothetical protein
MDDGLETDSRWAEAADRVGDALAAGRQTLLGGRLSTEHSSSDDLTLAMGQQQRLDGAVVWTGVPSKVCTKVSRRAVPVPTNFRRVVARRGRGRFGKKPWISLPLRRSGPGFFQALWTMVVSGARNKSWNVRTEDVL